MLLSGADSVTCRFSNDAVTVLFETHYLPSIAFFSCINGADTVMIERHEHYVKQSHRNRCHLVDATGLRELSIPVVHRSGKTLISQIEIDNRQKWVNNHWRTIQSAYGKAPFFPYYADDLHRLLYAKFELLYELNMQLLSMCLTWLKLNVRIAETTFYQKQVENGVLDLRDTISPKNTAGLNRIFTPVPYRQVFGSSFVENTSIIDLIFCVGPEAARTVKNSRSNN